MILYSNTSDSETIHIALIGTDGSVLADVSQSAKFQQEEKFLHMVDTLLQSQSIEKKQLTGIVAVIGPGGFSSLRIGISCANALAYALGIPILGVAPDDTAYETFSARLAAVPAGAFVEPEYGSEPNIHTK